MWPFDYFKKKPVQALYTPVPITAETLKRQAEDDRIEKLYKDNPPGPALDRLVFDAAYSEPDPHRWTIPAFSTDPQCMMDLLSHLSKTRHVRSRISVGDADEKNMDSDVTLWAGDCNCPHNKQYDPNDGHGVTYVPEMPGHTPMHAVALAALEICGKVKPLTVSLDKNEVQG